MRSKFQLIIVTAIFLSFGSMQQPNADKYISVNCEILKDSNAIAYYVHNCSKDSLFILYLASETVPEVYKRKSYDTTWWNITFSFYNDIRVLKDTSEIFSPKKENDFEYVFGNETPETDSFYNEVTQLIKESSLSLKSDRLFEFDVFMNRSIFLNPGEFYSDTISLSTCKRKFPESDLKFVFSYPSAFLYDSKKSFLSYFVEDFIGDSLGISFPKRLDGYKVVYTGSLSYEFIIAADTLNEKH